MDQAAIDQMQAEAAAGEQPLQPQQPFSVPNSGPGTPLPVAPQPPPQQVGPEGSLGPTPVPQNSYQGIGGVMPNAPVDALGNPRGLAVEPPPPQAPIGPQGAGPQPPPQAPQGPSLTEREASDLFNRADPTGKLRNGPPGAGNGKLLNEAEQLRDRERVMNSTHAYAEKARANEIAGAVEAQAKLAEAQVKTGEEKRLAFEAKYAADQERTRKWEAEQKKDIDPTRALQINTSNGVGGAIADGVGKIMLILAATLGGYANKGVNPGLAAIDNLVHNDIEAQKAELQNSQAVGVRKQNDLAQALDYFKNSTVAENALYLKKIEASKMYVDALKEKHAGSKLVEGADQLNLALDMKANEARQRMAAAQAAAASAWVDKIHANFHQAREERRKDFEAETARKSVEGAQAIAQSKAGAADKGDVVLPNGQTVRLADPKEAYSLRKGLSAEQELTQIHKELEEVRGTGASFNWTPTTVQNLKNLKGRMEVAMQGYESSISGTPSRMTKALKELTHDTLGDPTATFSKSYALTGKMAKMVRDQNRHILARTKLGGRSSPDTSGDEE